MLLLRFMMYLDTQDDAVFIESMIRCFAAPVTRGTKCASLLNLRRRDRDLRPSWARSRKKLERALSLKFAELSPGGQSPLLLIYREGPLMEALSSDGAKEMLLEYGYDDGFCAPGPYIREVSRRFRVGAIPHEVGLFLGYPHEDVRGFIENKGRNSKLSGYWKVYGDVTGALKKFAEFKKAEAESLSSLLERAGRLNPAEAA
jgi:hypothetical protein